MTDIEAINKEIAAHKRRLHKLREQKATYGLSADPRLEIEIEDIEAELKKLLAERQRLEGGTGGSEAGGRPAPSSGAGKYNLDATGGQVGVIGDNTVIQGGIHFHGGSPPPPGGSPGSGDGSYDLHKVRALLNDVFSEDDLRDFCLYETDFQPVYDELKESDRKPDILRRLVGYARQRGLVARLLAWARQTNGGRYAAGEPYEGDVAQPGG